VQRKLLFFSTKQYYTDEEGYGKMKESLRVVAFVNFQKATISFVAYVRLSVGMEQLGSQWTDFHEI
jgi:hypothetical protein